MGLQILLAESSDILRAGIRTILMQDPLVTTINEATDEDQIQENLRHSSNDLIIINQLLIRNMCSLPRNRFIVLASELDIHLFQKAYKHGAKGYLLESTLTQLLRITLHLPEYAFLIEPMISHRVLEYMNADPRLSIKEELLTPREKEVIELLRQGTDRKEIAQQLHISEATLKTHLKNISRKRDVTMPQ